MLELAAFSGREEMSRLFSYRLEMISDNNAIQPAQIVGKNVTFGVKLPDGSPRCFNGLVSRFFAGDENPGGGGNYRAEVVPWLWFLTRTADCRIFQNKTVPDIIQTDLQGPGIQRLQAPTVRASYPHARLLRPVPRDRLQLRLAPDGRGGHFLLLPARGGQAHAGVRRPEERPTCDCTESEVDYSSRRRHAAPSRTTSHVGNTATSSARGKWSQTDYNFEDHPARSDPTPAKLMMSNKSPR